jgi:oligosaccharide repeat unit polymerase
MKILYVFLLIVLVGTFGLVLNTVSKAFHVLNPILGWMVGLAYFVLAPLTVLTLNGGFKFPDSYGLVGNWWDIDLSRLRYLGPYLVIWLSLMLTCAVGYFLCPSSAHKQDRDRILSCRRLERIILITMALSVLDWIATIWLLGGVPEFLVSHWYTRAQPLIERFGSVFILYMRLSLANQILFTSAAALYTSQGLKHRNTRWGFTSRILLFLVLGVAMNGNRVFFALYLLAFLSSCWLYERKKIIVTLLAASPLIVLLFSVWAWVRQDVSKIPDSVERLVIDADMGNRAVTSLMDVTEGAAVMLVMNIVNDYGNNYEYLYGSTYSRLFTFFQPRILHPERTPDFQTITAARYEPGETTTLGSTALGEAYANFGFWGIFVLPLFTGLALRYSEWLTAACERHTLLSAVSFVMFVWYARATFAENSISLIGVAILIRVLKLEKGLCVRTVAGKTLAPAGLPSVFPPTAAEPSP